jgi:chloramphenicol O-acetyltransferase type A
MPEYLDVASWSRRDLFEFFKGYDNPYFNICTRLDVTHLLRVLRERPEVSVSLAYHYFALRVANEIESFHYRLKDGKVVVHEVINGGTTVLQPNESFTFAYFKYEAVFDKFISAATRSVKAARSGNGPFQPDSSENTIHFTTVPWVSFTSFAHARNWNREDSVPKIAFGKFAEENGLTFLPISIEVHHALMDGLHVGRYLSRLAEALNEPESYLRAKKASNQS